MGNGVGIRVEIFTENSRESCSGLGAVSDSL